MATIVFFHAHPDDEAIATGGTIARAAAAGHRIVLIIATLGELGEPVAGAAGDLADVRMEETHAAARILGVHRGEFLDYRDSGMAGDVGNDDPSSFWQTDVEEAAHRVAAILREERPDVFVVYDENGQYGHPDHIQVHRVGHRAATIAAVPRVYEVTINRDRFRRLLEQGELGEVAPPDEEPPSPLGLPDAVITTAVDVHAFLEAKRAAMAAHASQIPADSWFLSLPEDVYADAFGTEWFVRVSPPFGGDPVRDREDWLF